MQGIMNVRVCFYEELNDYLQIVSAENP